MRIRTIPDSGNPTFTTKQGKGGKSHKQVKGSALAKGNGGWVGIRGGEKKRIEPITEGK